MDQTFWIATQWIFLVLVASLVSIDLGEGISGYVTITASRVPKKTPLGAKTNAEFLSCNTLARMQRVSIFYKKGSVRTVPALPSPRFYLSTVVKGTTVA